MITPEEFVARWHETPLVRPTPESVQQADIPEPIKYFLNQAGIPCQPLENLSCEFLAQGLNALPTIDETYDPDVYGAHYVVGWWRDQRGYLCIDGRTGAVVSIPVARPHKQILANSGFNQFIECLLIRSDAFTSVRNDPSVWRTTKEGEFYLPTGESLAGRQVLDPQVASDMKRRIVAEMRNVDAPALDDIDSFWPYYYLV